MLGFAVAVRRGNAPWSEGALLFVKSPTTQGRQGRDDKGVHRFAGPGGGEYTSRRRLRRPGSSGVCTPMSASWKRYARRIRWPKGTMGLRGSDGVTFEAIEAQGVEAFLEQIADELVGRSYACRCRPGRQEIPKDGGKVRVLSIPAIRDRVA